MPNPFDPDADVSDPNPHPDPHPASDREATPSDQSPSRSQIKREHQALQVLAEQLVQLPRAELERLSLSEASWAAIDETPRIKDQRALRRHFKRIANCLAREDTEPLQALMAQREARARAASARHHQVERWRQRLIEQGDGALTALIEAFPAVDRQQLRSLLRAARSDAKRGRPDAPRRLFRFLRDLMDAEASRG